MREFGLYSTFFDYGFPDFDEENFVTVNYLSFGDLKKRTINNKLILRYLQGDKTLTEDDYIKISKILDGSIYTEIKRKYSHCKLCSNDFERQILLNFSKKYKYWELCIPTFPYYPGGLMIYLKDRSNLKIENLQYLSGDCFKELLKIEKDLYTILHNNISEDIVGVNILFNQISKSQLCIHGHVEFMQKDIHMKQLGVCLSFERPTDSIVRYFNEKVKDNYGVIVAPEGIRMNVDDSNYSKVLTNLNIYENEILKIVNNGKLLRENNIAPSTRLDKLLIENMSPAPVNFVYLTYYRDKYIISSVPEIILKEKDYRSVTYDERDLYCLKINRYYTSKSNIFLLEQSPLVRRSIKVTSDGNKCENIKILQKKIVNILEK